MGNDWDKKRADWKYWLTLIVIQLSIGSTGKLLDSRSQLTLLTVSNWLTLFPMPKGHFDCGSTI